MTRVGWVSVLALAVALGCSEDSSERGGVLDASAAGAGSGGDSAGADSVGGSSAEAGASGGAAPSAGGSSVGGAGTGGAPGGSGGAGGGTGGAEPGDASTATADASVADASSDATEMADVATVWSCSEGPSGKDVGDVVENYAFRGYVNDGGDVLSNTLPETDYTLDDARESGAPYALIHLSAFYCPGCRSAAMDLGNLAGDVQDAGGIVIEVLFAESPTGGLSAWVETYDLRVTTVAPSEGNTLVDCDADREHAFIVDLSTMRIVWTAFGSYGTTTNSSAKQGLAEMQRLLAE